MDAYLIRTTSCVTMRTSSLRSRYEAQRHCNEKMSCVDALQAALRMQLLLCTPGFKKQCAHTETLATMRVVTPHTLYPV